MIPCFYLAAINTNMIFFKIFFWYCLLTNNFLYIDKLCQYDWFYYLVKEELKDSGYYDETNFPSKNFIALCTRSAFYNIRNLDLPHYSYVYKYSKPLGDSSFYYPTIVLIDKIICSFEKEMIWCCDHAEKIKLQIMIDYLKKARRIYDKFDDISRPIIPVWQKRVYLANIKDILGDDDYDFLDDFQPIPVYALPLRD